MKKTLMIALVFIVSLALIGCMEKGEDQPFALMNDFGGYIDQDNSETLLLSDEPILEDGQYEELIDRIKVERQAITLQKSLAKIAYGSMIETGRSLREEGLELEQTDLDELFLLRTQAREHIRILTRTHGAPWALVLVIRESESEEEIMSHLESIYGLLRLQKEHLIELTDAFEKAENVLSPYLIR